MATLFITITLEGHRAFAEQSHATVLINLDNDKHAKEFYTDLDGDWNFFEQHLITPDEVVDYLTMGQGRIVSLPDSFENQTGDINSFGTYSTTIKIPKEYRGKTLAIHVPYQYSAYTLYIDQTEIIKNGQVGYDLNTHIAEMAPKTGYFRTKLEEVVVTIQVSSFEHIRGGFENSIYFGDASIVDNKFYKDMIGTLFMNGCIFIIGLFMILFALYRRQEHLFLIFGLFALLISARALFAVPFYYTLIFPDMSWLWGTRLEYVLTEATSIIYVTLLWKWHEKEFSKKVLYFLAIVHISLIVITLFTEPIFFQTLFFNVFYLAIPTFFYVVYVIAKSIRNNNRNAKVNLIGMALIFLAFFNDFAIGQNWYSSWNLMLPAVGIYVLLHVILMSKNFADSVRKTEHQNVQLLALNKSNEELAVQLQKEIKQKDDFLANTSHELRNPLHGIINIAQSILRKKPNYLNEEIKADLELLITIGHHMSRTVQDLLDISRLKEHRIQLQKEHLDIQSISAGVIDMFKAHIENKDIRMETEIPFDFPLITADKNRLIQILYNLLHNAVKFTDEGTIIVTARKQDDMVHIQVEDTGRGISEEALRKIFNPYEQGDSSITAVDGGLGLGLSICKQLIEMHGGTLKVSSVLGEGSIFTFTLPFTADVAEEQIIASRAFVSASNLSFKENPVDANSMLETLTTNTITVDRPNILIVDDNPVNLKVLTNILSEDHYEVKSVTSGKEALRQLELKEWDLIISDVMMPTMSGYELTRSIRKKFSISELPILLLTARSQLEDIYAGFLAGANDYVTKPVDAVELNVRVHALTDLKVSINERLGMEAAWLQAQIRPHFLFNTLNSIMSLGQIDVVRMSNLLVQFSNYLRNSFDMKNLDRVVPFHHELKLLESYLYIEQERFGDRLKVKWAIDDVKDVKIPPFSIQTLVENAVNHGVLKKVEGGTVTIKAHREVGYTEFSIIDDGIGMDNEKIQEIQTLQPDRKKGIGIVNTEQRLQQLYGKGLHIRSTRHIGTTITFRVPDEIDNTR